MSICPNCKSETYCHQRCCYDKNKHLPGYTINQFDAIKCGECGFTEHIDQAFWRDLTNAESGHSLSGNPANEKTMTETTGAGE